MSTNAMAHAYCELIKILETTTCKVSSGVITEAEAGRHLMTCGTISKMNMVENQSLSAAEIEFRAYRMIQEDLVDATCEKLLGGGQ